MAVTGGFELALNCDFLVASERARFGDTHARVGVIPGWGLVRAAAPGHRRPPGPGDDLHRQLHRRREALRWGLVNHVVPHDELLAFARRAGRRHRLERPGGVPPIAPPTTTARGTTVDEGLRIEAETARAWHSRGFDPAEVERRRKAIIDAAAPRSDPSASDVCSSPFMGWA